jgi:hypothetical protein
LIQFDRAVERVQLFFGEVARERREKHFDIQPMRTVVIKGDVFACDDKMRTDEGTKIGERVAQILARLALRHLTPQQACERFP